MSNVAAAAAIAIAEEEECTASFEPKFKNVVKVQHDDGEKDEQLLFLERCIIYRYVEKEWVERGRGDVRLLQHNTLKKVRIILRQEKTLKLRVNHFIPTTPLKVTNETTRNWIAADTTNEDGKPASYIWAIRFRTAENARDFDTIWNYGRECNTNVAAGKEVPAAPKPIIKVEDAKPEGKSDEPKTDAKATEDKPAEAKTEEPKAEEAKSDETKAEETKTEEVKTEEPKAEEAKVEETKPAEESKPAEETKP